MDICGDLNQKYKVIENMIGEFKSEIDLEFAKEKQERDYSKFGIAKREGVWAMIRELKDEILENLLRVRFPNAERVKIRVGGMTRDELLSEFGAKNIGLPPITNLPPRLAYDMLKDKIFDVPRKIEDMDFICLSAKDLGVDKECNWDKTLEKARSMGLELCPADVGPYLRLQYLKEDWIDLAMDPIIVGNQHKPYIFSLYSQSINHLSLIGSNFGSVGPGSEFFFRVKSSVKEH